MKELLNKLKELMKNKKAQVCVVVVVAWLVWTYVPIAQATV